MVIRVPMNKNSSLAFRSLPLKHGCQQANRQYHSPRPAVPVTSTPSYMEPIVPHPASKLHARPNSLDIRLETPSPEHLYEEIDLKSIKSVGEKSYANAELVNGSSDTSSSLRVSYFLRRQNYIDLCED
nr:uncharacterized protein LOC128693280 isoform X2 [Cherax quadricarinatus]